MMEDRWDLSYLYQSFDDPAFLRDMERVPELIDAQERALKAENAGDRERLEAYLDSDEELSAVFRDPFTQLRRRAVLEPAFLVDERGETLLGAVRRTADGAAGDVAVDDEAILSVGTVDEERAGSPARDVGSVEAEERVAPNDRSVFQRQRDLMPRGGAECHHAMTSLWHVVSILHTDGVSGGIGSYITPNDLAILVDYHLHALC